MAMPANSLREVFVIEAASQEGHEAREERYVVRTQLNQSQWTVAPTDIMGIYDVRWFLNDNGVEDKDIAFAIEELSRRKRVTVSRRFSQAA